MTPSLIYRDFQGQLVTVPLTPEGVRIGRDESCQIRARDPLVSSLHCHVTRRGNDWVVEDRGSANHTYVNGDETPITSRALHDRDVIRCASLWVQCLLPQPATLPAPPPPPAGTGALAQDLEQARDRVALLETQSAGLREERDGLRQARGQLQQQLRECLERLQAEQRVSAALRDDGEALEQKFTAARTQIKAQEDAALAHASELSMVRADLQHLRDTTTASSRGQEALGQQLATVLREVARLREEREHLVAVTNERDHLLEELSGAAVEQEQRLRTLQQALAEQKKEAARLQAERDRAVDEKHEKRLALEQAEEELRALNRSVERLGQIAANPDVPRLSQEHAKAQEALALLRQQSAELHQRSTVLFEGIQSVVLDVGERAFAIQRRYVQVEAAVTDRDAAQLLTRTIDQMIDQVHNAQAQMRALRRAVDSTSQEGGTSGPDRPVR